MTAAVLAVLFLVVGSHLWEAARVLTSRKDPR